MIKRRFTTYYNMLMEVSFTIYLKNKEGFHSKNHLGLFVK